MNETLRSFGWSRTFENQLAQVADRSLLPGRVVAAQRRLLRLQTAEGVLGARVAGRHFQPGASGGDLPVVGDWVAFDSPAVGDLAVIRELLPRRTRLSRKAAGERTDEQVVAANVDRVAIVMGLDGDYSPRRLERFLTMVEESGAHAAVVLNKADLCPDLPERVHEVRSVSGGAPVLAISALDGPLDSIELLLLPGETLALVGSSGAGKTTLINRLLGGGELPTRPVRAHDSRGRHTTTHRELFRLQGGCLIIDNPGVREIQPWSGGAALSRVFADLDELACRCRFGDCGHDTEPRCAVRQAIADGELDSGRLESWRRLEREAAALDRRQSERARREHDKRLGKLYRTIQREKRRSRR